MGKKSKGKKKSSTAGAEGGAEAKPPAIDWGAFKLDILNEETAPTDKVPEKSKKEKKV